MALTHGAYDLQSGIYYLSGITADSIGIITSGEQKPLSFWSAAGLAAGGVR
jgi:hypothetical protein